MYTKMMSMPSNRDPDHLAALRVFFTCHRRLPTYGELAQELGFASKFSGVRLVQRLTRAGYLEVSPAGRPVPGPRFFELPMLDSRVPAGTGDPSGAGDSYDFGSVDHLVVRHPDRTVLIRVSGDSMSEAGVLDGDTAVVERTDSASAGDFVVALVDGRYTVKELQYRGRRPVLLPRNRRFKPIVPRTDLQILGVVRGIIRSIDRPHQQTAKTAARSKP